MVVLSYPTFFFLDAASLTGSYSCDEATQGSYRELFRLYSVVDSLVPIEMIDPLLHCSPRGGKLIFGQWWVVEEVWRRWARRPDENLVGMEGWVIPVLLYTLRISKKTSYMKVSLLLAVSFIDGKFRCSELLQVYLDRNIAELVQSIVVTVPQLLVSGYISRLDEFNGVAGTEDATKQILRNFL